MIQKRYAMVLAAGRGERLKPLTDDTPKPLIQAGPHRLIEYHLHALARAGYTDIIINIAHLGQQIMDILGNGDRYSLCLHYSDERDAVLETGGGIANALPLLKSEQFLVINGDIWTDIDLNSLPVNPTRQAHLILVTNPAHNKHGDFSLQNELVSEKKQSSANWTYSGIGIFTHSFFQNTDKGRFPLAPLIREKIAHSQVSGQIYEGKWFDIGTVERLNKLRNMLKNSDNRMHAV